MEQITKHVEGQFNGQESTAKHGCLQVPGALESLEVSKTNSRLSSASCVAIPTPQTRLQKSNRRSPICGKTDDA